MIGYYAKEGNHKGRNWSGTHIVEDGKPICGYKPHNSMKFQWCSNNNHSFSVECKACTKKLKQIGSKTEKEGKKKLNLFFKKRGTK